MVATAQAVSINDYLIYGQNNVFIGNGSTINGRVGSTGNVGLNGGATVNGDIDSGANVSLGNGADVTGTITNPGNYNKPVSATVGAHVVGTPTFPTLPAPTIFSAGGDDYKNLGNGAVLSLDPDSYGDIQLAGSAELHLKSGDYFFNTLKSGNGLDLFLDLSGGPINIYVVGVASFGGVDVFLTNGGTANDVYLETHSTDTNNAFKAGGGVDWIGSIFAPYGGIHLGSGSGPASFAGYLHGLKVDIEHGVVGNFPPPPPPDSDEPPGSVPEPITSLTTMMGLASLMLAGTRRRKA